MSGEGGGARNRSKTVDFLQSDSSGDQSSILFSLPTRLHSHSLRGRGHLRRALRATTLADKSLQAAIYLQEGEDNDKFSTHPMTKRAVNAYRLVHNHIFWTLDLFASAVLLFLAIVEPPSLLNSQNITEYNFMTNSCFPEKMYYHKEEGVYRSIHTSVEILCLGVIALNLYMKGRWLGSRHFLRHKRTIIKLLLLAVMFTETIVIIIRSKTHVRVTRALRPFFLLDTYYCHGVRRVSRQIMQSLLPILDIVILLLAFILFSSLLAFFLFLDVPESVYFVDLWTSFVSLFILLTTANFPTVMMPVYNHYWWAPIFFILYLCISLYLIMNLLLAVVYSTFNTFEKEKFRKLFLHKREALCRAFDVLSGSSPMSFEEFHSLLSVYRPRWNQLRVLCVFKALNETCTGNLSLHEFLRFYDVHDMKWKLHNESGQARWYSFLSRAGARHFFRRLNIFIEHRFFRYFISISLVLFAGFIIYVAVETGQVGNPEDDVKRCDTLKVYGRIYWINLAFLLLYVVEALLKIVGLGPKNYFTDAWNVFDFACVLLSSIGMVADVKTETCTSDNFSGSKWLKYLFYIRVLRLVRLFQTKKRYREVLGTMYLLLPRLLNVALLILLLYYFFAIIGMECFKGLLCKRCCTSYNRYQKKAFNIAVNYNGQANTSNFYYLNNFDNILASYVTLFEQMIVNNWYIAMNAYTSSTHTEWTRVYFMLFFLVSSVVVAIVISFILDGFMFRIESQETVNNASQSFGEGYDIIEVRLSADEEKRVHKRLPLNHQASDGQYRYKGMRRKTKADFRLLLYADEIRVWVDQQEEKLDRERSITFAAGELSEIDDQPLLVELEVNERHFDEQ